MKEKKKEEKRKSWLSRRKQSADHGLFFWYWISVLRFNLPMPQKINYMIACMQNPTPNIILL